MKPSLLQLKRPIRAQLKSNYLKLSEWGRVMAQISHFLAGSGTSRGARLRFTYPRESRARSQKYTSRGIYAAFTWESRAVYVRYRPQIYGKYGGIGVLFGGGGSSSLQVSCVVRLPFSLFSLSLFAPFPPALCVRLQLQCSSPWTMVVRIQTSAKC